MVDARRYGVVTSELTGEFETQQRKLVQAGSSTVVLPDGINYFRLPKEKNFVKVDVLPFVAATENGPQPLARYNYHIHRNVGNGFASVICPQAQKGSPCPVCEYLRGLNWNDPEDQIVLRKYRAQRRQLYAVVPADSEKDDIFVFDTSEYGFGRILDEKLKNRDLTDPQESGWDKYADLLEGWSLKLNLCEQSFGGPQMYTAVSSIDFKPRTRQYSEDWYDKVPDLSQCIVMLGYDEIKAKFDAREENQSAAPKKEQAPYDPTDGYNPMVSPAASTVAPAAPVSVTPMVAGNTVDVVDSDPF